MPVYNEDAIIECVPNFSEGCDRQKISLIASAISRIDGVSLLGVESGEATNRTVITFAGNPCAVLEAAFCGAKEAIRLIDMREHVGEHPRLGVIDVLPIVPVSGITLLECAELARNLAKRLSFELHIPCYCYAASAYSPDRKSLSFCRKGGYETLIHRLCSSNDAPDIGDRPFDEGIARTGCTIIGARPFLVAVNFNLSSRSCAVASAIAYDVRQSGWPKVLPQNVLSLGLTPLSSNAKETLTLPKVMALGWFIEEYGIAQVSMNITDIEAVPLHTAYETVCKVAQKRGIRVTGTEIIGLVPRDLMLSAGRYFLMKAGITDSISEKNAIDVAIKSMSLDDLRPFDPNEKILEYALHRSTLCS